MKTNKDLCYLNCATIRKSRNIKQQQIALHNHALQIYNNCKLDASAVARN